MGETKVNISIRPFGNGKKSGKRIECIVDTGATLSIIPKEMLELMNIEKKGPIRVSLADGSEIPRYYGNVILTFDDGNEIGTRVLFGEKDDPALLGVVALETGGYTVDPIKGLIKKEYIHLY